MAIANLTAASLGTLIKEFAPEKYEQGANLASPLLGSSCLKQEAPSTMPGML